MDEKYVVIGAGIVGLAVARRLLLDRPHATVTVLEKERAVGTHQTGHNSGVIHSGVYYRPGSDRARLCAAGARSMVEFCQEYGVPVDVCGKLIVATHEAELPRLRVLAERAAANGVPARLVTPAEAKEIEPEVACLEGLHITSTGRTDFGAVCEVLARLVTEAGGEVRLGVGVTAIRPGLVLTDAGPLAADVIVNCAGLYADRLARPPVPDPTLPFLGVHMTRGVDGHLHAGPNAVLALSRRGYTWGRINPRDIAETAAYPGMWRLARRHLRTGVAEVRRSLSKRRFAADLARLVPAVRPDDLVRAPAGVRAQAVLRDGALADDFLLVHRPGQVHVLNAPSPAATSSLEIARWIVGTLPVRS
ncbi:MAG: hydroxyglutarate oxidase [Catenulispora sp. 13_1_20CM_3_70_7]|nr:MAG: hydroxyglutarate oxidase [Catenulispora sp. 13_1_20CM_3_70_7]